MGSDCSSVLGLYSRLEENLHSISPSNTNWTWPCEGRRLCWLSWNSHLRWRQPALPAASLAHPVPMGLSPSSELQEQGVCLRGTAPMWTLSGIQWGHIIVLNFYRCTKRTSHFCTGNCTSVNPMGQDSQSTELKRKLPSILSWGGTQHIPNMDG